MNPLPLYPSSELQLRRAKRDEPTQPSRKADVVIHLHNLSGDEDEGRNVILAMEGNQRMRQHYQVITDFNFGS